MSCSLPRTSKNAVSQIPPCLQEGYEVLMSVLKECVSFVMAEERAVSKGGQGTKKITHVQICFENE